MTRNLLLPFIVLRNFSKDEDGRRPPSDLVEQGEET